MVAASTTVGIPIAITGTPNESLVNSFLVFPTPAPGTIPVSAIWIELLILSILLDDSASIIIINFGLMFCTIPFNISCVSIPVVPSTPGDTALTDLVSSFNTSGIYSNKCLVISISFITFGPNASGVTYKFPSPTIKTESLLLTCLSINAFNSFVTTSDAFCISSSFATFKFLISIVI